MAKPDLNRTIRRSWETVKRFVAGRWGSLLALLVFLLLLVVPALLVLTNRMETGFGEYTPPSAETVRGKTLWDLLELVFVPLALAAGALFFTHATNKREHHNTVERTQEETLHQYLDRMSQLLLDYDLRDSPEEAEVRNIARAQTLTVLRQLNADRKGLVLKFLYESGLIGPKYNPFNPPDTSKTPPLKLESADLSRANLEGADLAGAVLDRANLEGVVMTQAMLSGTRFGFASLRGANLERAKLYDASLTGADLRGANLTDAELSHTHLQYTLFDSSTRIGEKWRLVREIMSTKMRRRDLRDVDLADACLVRADLVRADLRGAVLRGSWLAYANLEDADLRNANLYSAQLEEANLSLFSTLEVYLSN